MLKYLVYGLYFSLFFVIEIIQTDWIDRFYLFDILHSLKLQLFFLLFVFALFIAFFNKRASVLLITFTLAYTLYHFSFTTRFNEPSSRQFTVNQFNLSYNNPYIDSFFQRRLIPLDGLTVLFELKPQYRGHFITMRGSYFDYGSAENELFPDGIGVISKYPILHRIRHDVFLDTKKGVIIELHLAVADEYIRLFVLHPPSPRSRALWQTRNQMLAHLALLVNKTTRFEHTLVVADFNTTPWSHFFSYHTAMTSCYEYSGHYVSWLPSTRFILVALLAGLPIDNCLLSDSLSLSSFKVTYQNGSDHMLLTYDVNIDPSHKSK
jgi:endonuclease/exonuclease/phosphatase (EEP) superfamily protein YafD